ncbi:SMI1/KNR4 family protein [Streptacidiphilus sp. EB129]|uniref:SMI1/KNR4 family protein n=1 Tax=Streptacidiphilus sp. EB129 TaxID=3156262 RepID=UPI003515E41E
MVERATRRIAEEIATKAPAGWTGAVLTSTAGRGGASVSGSYTVPGAEDMWWRNQLPSPFQELMKLAEELRKIRGWEPTTLEITCQPSGEYRLVAFAGAITSVRGRAGGFQVVLDSGYRLPQPGSRQGEGTAAPAGDPDLAVARFREYMQRRAEILGRTEQLPPPASAAALDEAEHRIGRHLPADLRALYSIADGDGIDYGHRYLLGGNAWLALESLVAIHSDQSEPAWCDWELAWDSVVFDAEPANAVRRWGGHPGWLPFATREDGNYLAVDLAPARNGHPGQVIHIGRDYDDGPAYIADSVTSLLGHYLTLLKQGAYESDGDHISLLESTASLAPDRSSARSPT